jgi:hypothetical protein
MLLALIKINTIKLSISIKLSPLLGSNPTPVLLYEFSCIYPKLPKYRVAYKVFTCIKLKSSAFSLFLVVFPSCKYNAKINEKIEARLAALYTTVTNESIHFN